MVNKNSSRPKDTKLVLAKKDAAIDNQIVNKSREKYHSTNLLSCRHASDMTIGYFFFHKESGEKVVIHNLQQNAQKQQNQRQLQDLRIQSPTHIINHMQKHEKVLLHNFPIRKQRLPSIQRKHTIQSDHLDTASIYPIKTYKKKEIN